MTEAQVWAMMGVFTTLMCGMLTIVSTVFVRLVRAEVGGLRGELGGLRGEMAGRFEAVNARFDAVDQRITGLDRDVQALVRKNFGLDRGDGQA